MDRKNLPSLLLCCLLSVASLGTVHAAQLPTDAYDPFDPLGPFDSNFNADDLMKYLSQLEPPVEQPKPVETKKDPQVKTAAIPTREEKDTTDIFLNSFLTDRKPKKDEKQKADTSRFGYDRPRGKKQEEAVKISDKEHNAFIICKGRLTKPLMTIEDNILTLGINAPGTLKALKSNLYSLQSSLGTIAQKHHFYLRYMLIKERQKPIGQRVVDAINKLEALKIEKKLAFTEGYENLLDLEAQPVMSASERSTMIEKILSINSTLLDPLVKELETFVKEPSVVKAVDDKSKQREDATKELGQRGRWRNYGTDYRGPARAGGHSRTPPNYWDNPNNWGKSGYYDPYENYKNDKNNKDPKAEPAKSDQADDKKKASGGAPGKTYDEKEAERIQKKVKKELDDFSKNDDIKRLLALTNAPVLDPQLTDVVLDETVERAIKRIEEIQRHVSQLSTAATPLQPESKSTPTTKTTAAQPKPTSAQLARQGSEKDADDTPALLKQIEPQLKQYYSLMSKLAAPTANLYAHLVPEPFHAKQAYRSFPIMSASTSGEFAHLNQTLSVERLRSIICGINLDKGNSLKTTYDNFYNKRKTQIDAYETKRGAELAKYFDDLREKIEKCNASLHDSPPTARSPETFFQDFLTSLQEKLKGPGKNDKTVIESLNSLTLIDGRGRLCNLIDTQPTRSSKNIFATGSPTMKALERLCAINPSWEGQNAIEMRDVIIKAVQDKYSDNSGLQKRADLAQFINEQQKFIRDYPDFIKTVDEQITLLGNYHIEDLLTRATPAATTAGPIASPARATQPLPTFKDAYPNSDPAEYAQIEESLKKVKEALTKIKNALGNAAFPESPEKYAELITKVENLGPEYDTIAALYNPIRGLTKSPKVLKDFLTGNIRRAPLPASVADSSDDDADPAGYDLSEPLLGRVPPTLRMPAPTDPEGYAPLASGDDDDETDTHEEAPSAATTRGSDITPALADITRALGDLELPKNNYLETLKPMTLLIFNLFIARDNASGARVATRGASTSHIQKPLFDQALKDHKEIDLIEKIFSEHSPDRIKQRLEEIHRDWTAKPLATAAGSGTQEPNKTATLPTGRASHAARLEDPNEE